MLLGLSRAWMIASVVVVAAARAAVRVTRAATRVRQPAHDGGRYAVDALSPLAAGLGMYVGATGTIAAGNLYRGSTTRRGGGGGGGRWMFF